MKDYKLEYEKAKIEIVELRKQLEYERRNREQREIRAEEVRKQFKQLLLDVLSE